MEQNAIDCLNKFIAEWRAGNWANMYKYCTITWAQTTADKRDWCRRVLRNFRFFQPEIIEVEQHSDVFIDVHVRGRLHHLDKKLHTAQVDDRVLSFIMVKESAVRTPDVNGRWGVNPISLLRGINTEATNG